MNVMTISKLNEIMRDNDIILVLIANLKKGSIDELGDKYKLEYTGLLDTLFGDIERVQALNQSLENQILPQSWNQGNVKCLVCKPKDDIVIGMFFHEHRDTVQSYRFCKMLNEIVNEKWNSCD